MKTLNRSKHHSKNRESAHEPTLDLERYLRLFSEITCRELATSLATLTGELEFISSKAGSISTSLKESSFKTIQNAAEKALSLARNLRYFSVHRQLHCQILDVAQILLDTVELIEKELELNKIKITVLAEAGLNAKVDGGAIQQLILNLISHARKTLAPGGQITLSLKQVGHQLELKCADSGHGISERDLPEIFKLSDSQLSRQFQTENPVDVHQLGLAVSKALVEAHGGQIQFQSRIGQGTIVQAFLPYDPNLTKPVSFSEERRFKRIPLALPVEVLMSRGQELIKSTLTTLSPGGCFVKISHPANGSIPELNDTLNVRIFHFGEDFIEIPRARVASVSWAGSESGIGVEFVDFSDRARKILQAIVKAHSL